MMRNRPRIRPRIHEWLASYSFIRGQFVDGLWARLASHKGMISLRESQSATGEELRRSRTLLPSILDKAFKGDL
jgi:hypothetical protein